MKTIIIGNSGSGKTYLANKLKNDQSTVIHLDDLFWKGDGYNEKESIDIINQKIENFLKLDNWIVEGVFGELLTKFIPKSDNLIFLDLPWKNCKENLLSRGLENNKQNIDENAKNNFQELLKWAENYWNRNDQRSKNGHLDLFTKFKKQKIILTNHTDINQYIIKTNNH